MKTDLHLPMVINALAAALLVPLLLPACQSLVFWLCARWLGSETGYMPGFGFYWLFWCLFVSRALLGKAEFASILQDRTPLFSRANWLAALLWLTVTLVTVFMYAGEFLRAPLTLILLTIPLATLNGFCEEILWRGLYIRLFPRNPWLGILYPAARLYPLAFCPPGDFPCRKRRRLRHRDFFPGPVLRIYCLAHRFGEVDGRFPQFERNPGLERASCAECISRVLELASLQEKI